MSHSSSHREDAFRRPPTQNTALIREFNCLYTHDLRRKAKRWQDGFLRFHTFNKRVMVYDVPRNFVGDSHWRERGELADGDEVELERAAALVQVGEPIRTIEQDLTGLLEKKPRQPDAAREAPHTRHHAVPSNDAPLSSILSRDATQLESQRRVSALPMDATPKSLKTVLGTPRGAYGRALPSSASPFDQRILQEPGVSHTDGPAPKRARLHDGDRQRVQSSTRRGRPGGDRSIRSFHTTPPQAETGLRGEEVIEISDGEQPRTKPHGKRQSLATTSNLPPSPPRPVLRPKANSPSHNVPTPRRPEVASIQSKPPNPDPPPNPLRLAPRGSRRKLLCQEAQPPGSAEPVLSRTNAKQNGTKRPLDGQKDPTASRHLPPDKAPPSSSLSRFQTAQQARIDLRLNKRDLGADLSNDELDLEESDSRREQYENSIPAAQQRKPDVSRRKGGESRSRRESPQGLMSPSDVVNARDPTKPPPSFTLSRSDKAAVDETFTLKARNSENLQPPDTTTQHEPHQADNIEKLSTAEVQVQGKAPAAKFKAPAIKKNAKKSSLPPPAAVEQPQTTRTSAAAPPAHRLATAQSPGETPCLANHDDKHKDTGPWSREAFDLFGWNGPEDIPARK